MVLYKNYSSSNVKMADIIYIIYIGEGEVNPVQIAHGTYSSGHISPKYSHLQSMDICMHVHILKPNSDRLTHNHSCMLTHTNTRTSHLFLHLSAGPPGLT